MSQLEQMATTAREEKALRKTENVVAEEPLRNLAEIMQLPAGRRFLWEMLERCRIYQTTLAVDEDNRVDLAQLAFNEGERQLGLWLLGQMIEANPAAWLEMQQERLELDTSKEATARTPTQGDDEDE